MASKSPSGRVQPAWVPYFLRGLERTGEVRSAAADAGIDWSSAYQRRKAHPDFAERWEEALRVHEAEKARREEEEVAAPRRRPSTIASSGNGPPPPLGEDLIVSGGQVKRAGPGRWSKRKEAIFFDELAATANITRAAAAAGVSTSAVHARRMRHAAFRAKWEAVRDTAGAAIDMYLLEEAQNAFDPEQIDTGDVKPRVTIDQAIKISQRAACKRQSDDLPSWQDEADAMEPDAIEEMRERLMKKLDRLEARDRREKLAQGWSYDESYDLMIPPGYVQGPDYRPNEPKARPR